MSKTFRFFAVMTVVGLCVASFFGCTIQPTRSIHTLVITGNYVEPRLIADLIQVENGQPYLLVPNGLDNRIWFMPNKRTDKNTPIAVQPNNVREFISVMRPQRVVILGDEKFVPASYEKAIPSNITKLRIANTTSWTEVARTCQQYMALNYLVADYNRISYDLSVRHDPNSGSTYLAPDGVRTDLNVSEPSVYQTPPPAKRVTTDVVEVPVIEPVQPPQLPVDDFVVPK